MTPPIKNPLRKMECFFGFLFVFAFVESILLGVYSSTNCKQHVYSYDEEYGGSVSRNACPATFEYTCTGAYDATAADDIHYSCGWQTREKVLGGVALFQLLPFAILAASMNERLGDPNRNRAGLLFLLMFALFAVTTIFLVAGGCMFSVITHGDIEGEVKQAGYKACASLFLASGVITIITAIFFFCDVGGELTASVFKIFNKRFNQRVVIPSKSPTPLPLT